MMARIASGYRQLCCEDLDQAGLKLEITESKNLHIDSAQIFKPSNHLGGRYGPYNSRQKKEESYFSITMGE